MSKACNVNGVADFKVVFLQNGGGLYVFLLSTIISRNRIMQKSEAFFFFKYTQVTGTTFKSVYTSRVASL